MPMPLRFHAFDRLHEALSRIFSDGDRDIAGLRAAT